MKETLYIAELISKDIRGLLSTDEQKELEVWLKKSENQEVYNRARSKQAQLDKLEVYSLFNKEKVRARIEDELFPTKKVDFTFRRVIRYAAAILLPVILVAGGYFLFQQTESMELTAFNEHIQPGSEKAILVLSSGEQVELEVSAEGFVLMDGKSQISNKNAELVYVSEGKVEEEITYNQLHTPKGGNYKLILADGTKVWLNSGSSLRFPTSFPANSRNVYLEGEAYFDVTSNGKSFTVESKQHGVAVMGTAFNVSVYPDDEIHKTTLVEGKVQINSKLNNHQETQILSPGEQAVLNLNSKQVNVKSVDPSFYTSWMQGKIEFKNEDLEVVMKRLARWYNFEYSFNNEAAKGYHFTARLDKQEEISSILEMLELTVDVSFDYKNDVVVVN